jgi:predicted nucleic acid-binding protein
MNPSRNSARSRASRHHGANGSRGKEGCGVERKNGNRCESPGRERQSTSPPPCVMFGRTTVKYVDASVLLRLMFAERGITPDLADGETVVSSDLVEVETFRALERERLLGNLDDEESAVKRRELVDIVRMLDLAPIDARVIHLAKSAFGVNVRALDAIHVATAQVLAEESGGEPLTFWTHDARQSTAALARGLTVMGIKMNRSFGRAAFRSAAPATPHRTD